MKKIIILIIALVLIVPLVVECQFNIDDLLVDAAGTSTENYTVDNDDHDAGFTCYSTDKWPNQVDGHPDQRVYTINLYVGWSEYGIAGDDWNILVGLMGFPAVSVNGTILDASVYLYVVDAVFEEDWNMFLALYEGAPSVNHTLQASDLPNAYNAGSDKLSTYEYVTEAVEGYYIRFDIDPDEFEYLAGDEWGYVWMYIMTTNHAINMEPERLGTREGSNVAQITFHDRDDPNPPILMVNYMVEGVDRAPEYSTNAAVVSENTSGIVDTITWQTPRAAYGDEVIAFDIAGNAGTPLQLELVTKDDATIASRNDSIRADGHYYWQAEVSNSSSGFIRCVDTRGGVPSEWGYVAPSPQGQDWNTTMCVDTQQYHYRQTMAKFVTGVGDYMVVHWKTNIDGTTELNDYNLQLWRLGLSDDSVYSSSLAVLAENYYKNIASNNDMLHWRYAIFTMDESQGFNDYDGMAISCNLSANSGNYGFYTPEISDNSSVSITQPLDAYWYIPMEQDGVILSRSSAGGVSTLAASVGIECKVQSDLNSVILNWVDNAGNPIGSGQVGGQAYQTLNIFTMPEPQTLGDYYLRVEFSDADTDFVYTRDIPFVVDEGAKTGVAGFADDIGSRIESWLDNMGLNNTAGHWLVMMIVMAISFIVFYKSELLRVVFPMLVFGFGFVMDWIDPWIIVLLALGAGFTLFNLFRKKVAGGVS